MTSFLFLENHLKGGDLATISVHERHMVGCCWAHSENTLSFMTIDAFYLFESLDTLVFSLSKGKGNLFEEKISIPNRGGHWSCVYV